MDFFEHQDAARRATTRLILLFLLAVAGIVVMVYALVMAALVFQAEVRYGGLWQPRVFTQTAIAVCLVILAGSLWKIRQLARGGAALAERVGGRRLDPASTDPLERRILNVVEEMAIASGVPVPPVYLLDRERGINAFAAGRDTSDAVIGVTRGAVAVLDREELQGVVAHEFSHILHGDMSLNLQLVGLVHGIELIGMVGRMLVHGGYGRGGKRAGKGGGGAVGLGLALMVIGGIGSLSGKLIRSAVSKQREFLADAAAVQFTRNPGGITRALTKIGGFGFGSHLGHPARAELAHMFFGTGVPAWDLGQIFGTHPPIAERIRRVDPTFDGSFPTVPLDLVVRWEGEPEGAPGDAMAAAAAAFADAALPARERRAASASGLPGLPGGEALPAGLAELLVADALLRPAGAATVGARASRGRLPPRPRPLLERLGEPGPEHLSLASGLMASLSPGLRGAARDPGGAQTLAYALVGGDGPQVRAARDRVVEEARGAAVLSDTRRLRDELESADPRVRLPLTEVAAGTLAGLEADAYSAFRDVLERLLEVGGETDLSAWVRSALLLHQLDRRFGRVRPARARYTRLSGLDRELALVLSALAHGASDDEEAARQAFAAGALELRLDGRALVPADACTHRTLEASLATLAELVPAQKKRVLAACARAVANDREVSEREAELFRLVADWLDCPAPPLLPGQRIA